MAKNILLPFEQTDARQRLLIGGVWLTLVIAIWYFATGGQAHLIPSPLQVGQGLADLYKNGLAYHIGSSLGLCLRATGYALIIALPLAYFSTIPAFKTFAVIASKLRYVPFAGLTFYLAVVFQSGRSMQLGVLTAFMVVYFVTALMAMIQDIPEIEFDHDRTLRSSRWEMLWRVVIKGRLDYVFEILRQNLSIVWMMIVTVESIIVSEGGLGVLIKNSEKFANHGRIIALQIVILLIGLGIDYVLTTLRKTLFPYSKF